MLTSLLEVVYSGNSWNQTWAKCQRVRAAWAVVLAVRLGSGMEMVAGATVTLVCVKEETSWTGTNSVAVPASRKLLMPFTREV